MARQPEKRTQTRSAPHPDGPAGDILQTFSAKSYESIARLTRMIWQAARADADISLEPAFRAERREQQALNAALNERFGLKRRSRRSDGEVVTMEAGVRSYFDHRPAARTNYAHQLKRASRIAAGLLDLGVTNVSFSKGSLTISGGRVKQAFGADPVGLGDRASTGQRTPVSFADIEALAREKRGQSSARKSSARGLASQPLAGFAIEDEIGRLRGRIAQLRRPSAAQRKALAQLRDAVSRALEA